MTVLVRTVIISATWVNWAAERQCADETNRRTSRHSSRKPVSAGLLSVVQRPLVEEPRCGSDRDVEPESAACGSASCDCGTTSGCADAASEKVSPCLGDGDCPDVLCDGQRCLTPAGFALRFSGHHVVRVAPGRADDFTIEMWLKSTQTVATNQWFAGGVLYQADKPGPADDFGAAVVGDRFGCGTGNPDVTATSRTPVNTGEWFHVAGTRVKSTGVVRIFVNGARENILTTGNTMTLAEAPPPWIGGRFNGQKIEHGFVGVVDELRV